MKIKLGRLPEIHTHNTFILHQSYLKVLEYSWIIDFRSCKNKFCYMRLSLIEIHSSQKDMDLYKKIVFRYFNFKSPKLQIFMV